jgi:hypothetical protein
VEQEEAAIARQRRHKRVSTSTNKHATVEELLEMVFSIWSVLRLYSEDQPEKSVSLELRISSQYLAMTSEQTEDFMCAVVVMICRV